MTTATAQASPNIAFIKLVQWNTVYCFSQAGFAREKDETPPTRITIGKTREI